MPGMQQALNTHVGLEKGRKGGEGRGAFTCPPKACQGLLLWLVRGHCCTPGQLGPGSSPDAWAFVWSEVTGEFLDTAPSQGGILQDL